MLAVAEGVVSKASRYTALLQWRIGVLVGALTFFFEGLTLVPSSSFIAPFCQVVVMAKWNHKSAARLLHSERFSYSYTGFVHSARVLRTCPDTVAATVPLDFAWIICGFLWNNLLRPCMAALH